MMLETGPEVAADADGGIPEPERIVMQKRLEVQQTSMGLNR